MAAVAVVGLSPLTAVLAPHAVELDQILGPTVNSPAGLIDPLDSVDAISSADWLADPLSPDWLAGLPDPVAVVAPDSAAISESTVCHPCEVALQAWIINPIGGGVNALFGGGAPATAGGPPEKDTDGAGGRLTGDGRTGGAGDPVGGAGGIGGAGVPAGDGADGGPVMGNAGSGNAGDPNSDGTPGRRGA